MQRFKTYGQNNIDSKLLPFTLFFGPKMAIKKEALPMSPQRSSLCLWNQWIKRNENSQLAKQESTFRIPPPQCIWVIPPSHSKNLLALVKVQILEPSGRVLPKWLHLCPSGFRKFTCVSAQISRNISMTCLLDGSRSRRSWGFPNFHGFWAAPGAIWSRLDGSQQETDCSIRNFGPCSTNSSKKILTAPLNNPARRLPK